MRPLLRFYLSCLPTLKMRPTPPPTGTVHSSPLSASQFAIMIGEDVRYRPSLKL